MRAAFDSVADSYDDTFTSTTLGRWFRRAVWDIVSPVVSAGDFVLDAGCGTGEDALWLARRGAYVRATDVSEAMLDVVRRKTTSCGLESRITVSSLDIAGIDAASPPPTPPGTGTDPAGDLYDGVLANFGVLNCLDDWRPLARGLEKAVRPGGYVFVGVMGPFCPWEWVWFLARGQPVRAFRRLRRVQRASIGPHARVGVSYPSPRAMRRAFSPEFVHQRTTGLGVVLPPSYGNTLVDRHRRWFEKLAPWDRRLGRTLPGAWLNDHYLMLLRKA